MWKFCIPLIMILLMDSATAQRWVVHEKHDGLELFSEAQVGTREIVKQLTDVRRELGQLVELSDRRQNVEIVIFQSPSSYQRYLSAKVPEAMNRRAIFYKSGNTFQIYAFRHRDLVVDLRHEFTHALLHQALPYVPLWLDEGLAEFMEEQPHLRANSSRKSAMKWRCRTGWKPQLTRLEAIPSAAGMDDDDYRDSWAWVSYLVNVADGQRLLKEFLQAISAGEAPGSFSDWVAARDTKVANGVGSYFRRVRISLR